MGNLTPVSASQRCPFSPNTQMFCSKLLLNTWQCAFCQLLLIKVQVLLFFQHYILIIIKNGSFDSLLDPQRSPNPPNFQHCYSKLLPNTWRFAVYQFLLIKVQFVLFFKQYSSIIVQNGLFHPRLDPLEVSLSLQLPKFQFQIVTKYMLVQCLSMSFDLNAI